MKKRAIGFVIGLSAFALSSVRAQEHRLQAAQLTINDAVLTVTATSNLLADPVEVTAIWSLFRAQENWTAGNARAWARQVDSLLAVPAHPGSREETVFRGDMLSPMFERRVTQGSERYNLYFEDGFNRFVLHPNRKQLMVVVAAMRRAASDADRLRPQPIADSPSGESPSEVVAHTAGVDFLYPAYLDNIVRQISLNFKPPNLNSTVKADVAFLIHRDGSATNFRFIARSGIYTFDLEAQGAVEKAASAFGPLPDGFGEDSLAVICSFGRSVEIVSDVVNSKGATYYEYQVERPAAITPNSPRPAYPEALRSTKKKGRVDAAFVVDQAGHVDVASLKIIHSADSLFTTALREALPNMRFTPAEIGGQKVRELVQMPFDFTAKP